MDKKMMENKKSKPMMQDERGYRNGLLLASKKTTKHLPTMYTKRKM